MRKLLGLPAKSHQLVCIDASDSMEKRRERKKKIKVNNNKTKIPRLTLTRYLGPTPIWNWLTANTAIANTPGLRQNVHKDSAFDHPRHPYYFIANVPLCDFSAANGATEFWLGSHVGTSDRDQQVLTEDTALSLKIYSAGGRIPWITEAALEARRRVRPPVQPEVGRGDIMIRDLRLWHAGMPNSSGQHRIMLGLGYMVSLSGWLLPSSSSFTWSVPRRPSITPPPRDI